MRIVVNYPAFLLRDNNPIINFHGYNAAFVLKYADAIYVQNDDKAELFRQKIEKLELDRKVQIIQNVELLDPNSDVVVGFKIGSSGTADLENFNGLKIFHTLDYYLDTTKQNECLLQMKADYCIGHSQLDKVSPFFAKYYPEYVGKVISLPFGYSTRFVNYNSFCDRKKKAVGLGSINLVKDAMCTDEQTKECVEFFAGRTYTHETRKHIQDYAEDYADCIDALFPTPKMQKDFSYDAVEMLNGYKMFVNDAGMSHFPPARTYEGIACGCVMVAEKDDIYHELGFIPDVNYISFEKNNYKQMIEKIRYYIQHEEQLEEMQRKSLMLAKNYSHEKVADMLYKKIKKIYGMKKVNVSAD